MTSSDEQHMRAEIHVKTEMLIGIAQERDRLLGEVSRLRDNFDALTVEFVKLEAESSKWKRVAEWYHRSLGICPHQKCPHIGSKKNVCFECKVNFALMEVEKK